MMECDACGKAIEFEACAGWLSVKTIVPNAEVYAQYIEAHEAGKRPADFGEVCSLTCLASWAMAASNLRALDEEVVDE
jgi:hypothetical protein